MTPAGIRTRRAISGPRRTKSSSPAKDPTGAPLAGLLSSVCHYNGPPAISRSAPLSGFVRSGSRQRGNSTFRAFAAALVHFREQHRAAADRRVPRGFPQWPQMSTFHVVRDTG